MLKVQEIREIIKLIDQSSINEFTYETNGTKLKLKKEAKQSDPVAYPVYEQTEKLAETVSTHIQQPVQPNPEMKTVDQVEVGEVKEDDYDHEIVSPMVGTFYRASSPDSEPFVKEGSRITPDTVVCIVEAMKLFNEIEAEASGEIVEILVEDGELVEYGQPLFRVKN